MNAADIDWNRIDTHYLGGPILTPEGLEGTATVVPIPEAGGEWLARADLHGEKIATFRAPTYGEALDLAGQALIDAN